MVGPIAMRLLALVACVVASASLPPQNSPLYRLPFPVGDSAVLLQGNNGRYGHSGRAAFAFDFERPIGSPVIAARSGRVVAIEDRYADGNRTPGQENFIIVQHPDSTFGRYYHLTQHGVMVSVGARVSAGQVIGRTGDTGASAGPHLHFDVTEACYQWGCQTIPITFSNVRSNALLDDSAVVALPVPQ